MISPTQLRGIVWLGTRTERFDTMARFVGDALHIPIVANEPPFAAFELPSGDHFEIFGIDDEETVFMRGPAIGFLVDDIDGARAKLEARGILFIGPVHRTESGNAWSQFFAPDGNVYEITNRPDLARA
jgi:hypothetical protein